MRVSLVGLSPRGINLMNLSTEPVQLILSHLFIPSLDVSFLFMCASAHDTVFNAYLWFGFINTSVLIFARHLAFATPLVREFWLPGSSCPDPGARSWWILLVADQSGAAEVWIIDILSEALSFHTPCSSLKFSFCNSWASFCIVHDCISLCILAFVPISDVIFL